MYDMWKRQYVHENTRKMHRAKVPVKKKKKMEKATFGRTQHGKQKWTGRVKF